MESNFFLLFLGFHCGKGGQRQGKGTVTCHEPASTVIHNHIQYIPTVLKFKLAHKKDLLNFTLYFKEIIIIIKSYLVCLSELKCINPY